MKLHTAYGGKSGKCRQCRGGGKGSLGPRSGAPKCRTQEPFLPCRPPPRPPSPCSLGWAPCSSPALSPSESPSVPLPAPVPLTHCGGCQTGNPSLCRPAPISWEETHCQLVAFLLRNPRFPVGVGFCRPIPFSLPLVSHLLGPLPPPLCWCPSLIIS